MKMRITSQRRHAPNLQICSNFEQVLVTTVNYNNEQDNINHIYDTAPYAESPSGNVNAGIENKCLIGIASLKTGPHGKLFQMTAAGAVREHLAKSVLSEL